ncbi:tyrosine-type recombinase/integrase [Streptomyces sp. ALI-76-A]|uniref:tyrosine-type recombinase/integrase n=1 Tax=Streptomyces sp. ALI-76-A TaxID=3025736 RepID=UPI00256F270D|nr:tyrosine-type recombinase/integrase [Streptomyces sp. ALI-76-A]MDL5204977.1 tyrosine-type recombinase/integrase [Streptomyces sp. ALI-76-A]
MARRTTPKVSEARELFLLKVRGQTQSRIAVNQYSSVVRRFELRVNNCQVGSLTPEHVEDFFFGSGRSLNSTCGPTTLGAYKTRLKSFLRFCHRRGWLTMSPDVMLEEIRAKTRANRNRYRMTRAELRTLLDVATDPRDRALAAFVANTGVRISEAIGLTVRDVSFPKGELYVTLYKTREEVTLPMSSDLERELRVWLTAYTAEVGELQPGYRLFPPHFPSRFQKGKFTTQQPLRLNPEGRISNPRVIIQALAKSAGIELEPGDGWHTLRRSFGRILYEDARAHGHDDALRLTQAALNHARAETTERYLGLDLERQRYEAMVKGKPFLTADLDPGKIVTLDERRAGRG